MVKKVVDSAATTGVLEGEVLPPVKDGKIVAFSKTESALSDLKVKYGDVTKFDVTTEAGLTEGKKAVRDLVSYRTSLEKMRVELKAPSLARGRLIDDEAKRITAELEKIETPLTAHVKAEELRLKAIEDARALAEEARVTALQARLQRIKEAPLSLVGAPLEKLKATHNNLAGIVFEEFQEFADSAKLYQESALNSIDGMIKGAEEAAAQEAELAKQRAILNLRDKINEISVTPSLLIGKPAEDMRKALAVMQADRLEWAGFFLDDAVAARASAITQLHNLIAGQEQMDAMRAQLAALQPAPKIVPTDEKQVDIEQVIEQEKTENSYGSESCVHNDDPLTCEVCNGDGVWVGITEVSPKDVAACMDSEFSDDVIPTLIPAANEAVRYSGHGTDITATYADGTQSKIEVGDTLHGVPMAQVNATQTAGNPITSSVVNDNGEPTVIGKAEIINAVHKFYGVSIVKAAMACAAAFKEQ